MRSSNFSKNERIHKVQAALKEQRAELCLITNPVDLYYLTGLNLSSGKLLVHPKLSLLFVDGRYIQVAEEKRAVPAVLDEADALLRFCERTEAKKIIFDPKATSFLQYQQFKMQIEGFQKKSRLRLSLIPDQIFFQRMRLIKDAGELKALQRSAALLWKGYQHILRILKPGITEKDVAREFEIYCLQEGAEKLAFDPIIAFGPNSAMPHYRAGKAKWKKNQIVLIDIGVVLNQYHSDMTRTILPANCDPFLQKMYDTVLQAQQAALKMCRPGVKIGQLDLAARKVMKCMKLEPFFLHSLGHGIGLETHEFPRIRAVGADSDVQLEEGMVITVEPGLYVAGKGGGRYEDTIAITKNGYVNFFPMF